MRVWTKWLFALAAPLTLSACLWTPGKFDSQLSLRKGGTFVLDYRGEILLQVPSDKDPNVAWSDRMARCYKDGRIETTSAVTETTSDEQGEDVTPCTAAQVAKLRADYEKQAAERSARERQEAEKMATMFGLPGSDDESNRQFAAKMLKYPGWRSATYRGKGVFDVVYHFEGRADQDFAFPMMPESDLILPFVTIRRRVDGSVQVAAPAFTGAGGPFGARAMASGIPAPNEGPVSKAQGRFTITTDGEILTNNTEDGPQPVPNGRQLRYDVGSVSKKIPEALIRL